MILSHIEAAAVLQAHDFRRPGHDGRGVQVRRVGSGQREGPGGFGTGQKTDRRRNGGQHRHHQHPDRGLFIVEHRLDPRLNPHLAEGQRTGRHRAAADAAPDQCLGVIGPVFPVKTLDDPLVAGQLQIPAQQDIGQPQQGLEPIDAQQHKAQQLPPVVPAGDMGPLVGQHMLQVLVGETKGHIDPGPRQAQHEGRGDLFALIDVVPKPDRRGHPAAQPQIAQSRVEKQGRRPGQPEKRQNGNPDLQRVGAGSRIGRKVLLERRIDDPVHGLHTAGNGRSRRPLDVQGHGLGAGQQAPDRLHRHRAQEPQGHHGPEQQPRPLGRFFQQQPQHQHRQHQPARRDGQIDHPQK